MQPRIANGRRPTATRAIPLNVNFNLQHILNFRSSGYVLYRVLKFNETCLPNKGLFPSRYSGIIISASLGPVIYLHC